LQSGQRAARQRRAAEALERFRKAVALDPGLVEARIGQALALRDLGREDEARDQSRQLLEEQPESAAVLIHEGERCLERDDTKGAAAAFRRAIELQSANADAHYQLGNVLTRQLKTSEAITCYQRVLTLDPSHARARWALTMAQIPALCSEAGEIPKSRSNFTRMLGELDRWFDADASTDGYKAVGTMQPFYLAYQEYDNRDLLSRYGSLCSRLMASWQKTHVAPPAPRTVGPIRVGIASAQLREHSVWNAIVKGWVRNLDRNRFELHLFNLGAKSDGETEQARESVHRLESQRHDMTQWASIIAASQLDLLIYPEIGMDPLTVKLANLRLAPVQAATWGHPSTTGLPTIDYFLSAEALEPPDAAAHYSEKLVFAAEPRRVLRVARADGRRAGP
jgi:predicted O-linked N-acetylglucosamine transferase (SPINDLY family)